MKKRFLIDCLVVCLAIATLTACSEPLSKQDKCYKVEYRMENGTNVTEYIWMDAEDAEWQEKYLQSKGYSNYKATHELSLKTAQDCRAKEEQTNLHL